MDSPEYNKKTMSNCALQSAGSEDSRSGTPISNRSKGKTINSLIHIIDKDEGGWTFLEKTFEQDGCIPTFFETVDDFFNTVSQSLPDILLISVDVFDPDILEHIRRIRRSAPSKNVPYVISMSYFMPGSFDQLLRQAGCDLCVRKSDEFTEVIAALRAVNSEVASGKLEIPA